MKKTKTALILLSVSGSLFSADAEMTVRFSSAQPMENVKVSHLPATKAGWGCRNSTSVGRRDMGQSFKAPSSFMMDSFSFQLSAGVRADAAGAPITITIFESDWVHTIGKVISTQKGTYLSRTARAVPNGWVTFDIDDIPVTAGKYYTVMLSWDEAKPTMEQGFLLEESGTFKDGQAWTSVDGKRFTGVAAPSGSGGNPRDVVFIVQAAD